MRTTQRSRWHPSDHEGLIRMVFIYHGVYGFTWEDTVKELRTIGFPNTSVEEVVGIYERYKLKSDK